MQRLLSMPYELGYFLTPTQSNANRKAQGRLRLGIGLGPTEWASTSAPPAGEIDTAEACSSMLVVARGTANSERIPPLI
ncbi:hypothetical protein Pelo_7559 [Pelomyxa schiedti]|nr:hypothetical protein Pelo_7559 [Pelomyxa schiedti]